MHRPNYGRLFQKRGETEFTCLRDADVTHRFLPLRAVIGSPFSTSLRAEAKNDSKQRGTQVFERLNISG